MSNVERGEEDLRWDFVPFIAGGFVFTSAGLHIMWRACVDNHVAMVASGAH